MNVKLLSIFLSIFIAATTLCAQNNRSPFPGQKVETSVELGLRGKVQRIIVHISANGISESHVFDRAGRLVENTEVAAPSERRVVYKYDASGNLIGYEGYVDKQLAYTVQIKLNADKLPVEAVMTDHRKDSEKPSNWRATYEYKLAPDRRVVERLISIKDPIGFDGGFILSFGFRPGLYREVFRYDDRGNRTEHEFYLPAPDDDFPLGRNLSKYDSLGRKVEESNQTSMDRKSIDVFRYNDLGDIVEIRKYEPVTEATRREVGDRFTVVDERGTVQNGMLTSDRPNNVLWDVTKCSYEYDQVGNWISKTCFLTVRDGKIAQDLSFKRTIEYFPK